MTKAVLILGAGASLDYGLPTGQDLLAQVEQLCREAGATKNRSLQGELFFVSLLSGPLGNPDPGEVQLLLKQMAELIDGQLPPSIDWFLGQQLAARFKAIRQIGMLAIAWCIGRAEQDAETRNDPVPVAHPDPPPKTRPHWLRTFWQSLGIRNVEDFQQMLAEERLRVITFNYERTFEQFLLNRLRALHLARSGDATGQVEAERKLRELDVFHVYGDLGELQTAPLGLLAREIKRSERLRDTTPALPNMLEAAASRLQVIAAERSAEQEARFTKPRQWIEKADRVVFLGFGFDETNVRALGFPGLSKYPHQVFATTYGLGRVARETVCQNTLKGNAGGHMTGQISHDHQSWDIEEYLRHFQPFRNLAGSSS